MYVDTQHYQILIYAIGAGRFYGFFLIHSIGCCFSIVLSFDIVYWVILVGMNFISVAFVQLVYGGHEF